MKITSFLLFFIFIPLFSISQNDSISCSEYVKIEYDKFTDVSHVKNSKELFFYNKLNKLTGFDFYKYKYGLELNIITPELAGCIREDTRMYLVFRELNEKNIWVKNYAGFNCKGIYKMTLYNKRPITKFMRDYLLESIRIVTNNEIIEIDFTLDQANDIKNTINCLFDYKQ
jgi:hypothetical protein